MTFLERLDYIQKSRRTLLCVGLDPNMEKTPSDIAQGSNPIYEFNKRIIDETADLVCAYKPQIAYYAAVGAENELQMTIAYINSKYSEIPVILDSKRGDIGPTAEMYAKEAFERYKADAVTVNPYLGIDSVKPFADWADKGVVVLCKTSNKSSSEFQDAEIEDKALFLHVATKASTEWNYNKNILLVIGATYPEQMKMTREIAPETVFLVPGVGAQGGSMADVMKNGLRKDGLGLIINSSRAIIHAGSGKDFASRARDAAMELLGDMRNFI